MIFRRLLVALCLIGAAADPGSASNVVVVVIDGARYSETFGAESTYVPRMWNFLRPSGMIWTNDYNDGVTSTNPGHASIATGTWQSITNDGMQRPTMPTIFEYFRSGLREDETEPYIVLGKAKLDILSYSTHPDFGAVYAASVVIGAGDADVLAKVRTVMNSSHPRLMMVNFADVDIVGHSGSWPGYLAAIRAVDSLVHELWMHIQTDPFYRDSTTLFVTNDHGRHDDTHGGFRNHGDGCNGCRHLMLLAVGRRLPQGQSVSFRRTQLDVAPTVGELLGFDTPFAAGTSLLGDITSTSSGEPDATRLRPSGFVLAQNYPNPFNPTTSITFDLPTTSHARLAVYDLLGREVRVLLSARTTAGSYRRQFDASGLASGVYLYRLTAGVFLETKAMILAR